MESLNGGMVKVGFIDHVFRFDNATKDQLMNMAQYALLAMVPVVTLNKGVQRLFPEPDDEKLSYVLLVEIIAQVLVLFLGMFYIHRFITYFTPYSRHDYEPVNMLTIMIAFLIIIFSFQTKVGEKVNILYERLMDLWNGEDSSMSDKGGKKKGGNAKGQVRVTQPIANAGGMPSNIQRGLEGFNGGMNPLLPSGGGMTQNPMSRNANPNMMNAMAAGQQQMDMAMGVGMPMGGFEPMPANGFGGFSSF